MPRLIFFLCFIAHLYPILSSTPEFAFNETGLMDAYKYQGITFNNYVHKFFRQSPIEFLILMDKKRKDDYNLGHSLMSAISFIFRQNSELSDFVTALRVWAEQVINKLIEG